MADKICNGCGQKENSGYEVALAFAERTTVRLWVVIILLITLLVGTNIGWLVYEAQFETVETTETNSSMSGIISDDSTVFNNNQE